MAGEYSSTSIPRPNRFLVEEQISMEESPGASGVSSGQLVIEQKQETPSENTNSSNDLLINNEELMEQFKKLFPNLGVDLDELGTIINEYSSMKSTLQQLQDKISMGISEEYQAEILGVGGLDGLYTKIREISSEIEILKDNIRLAVSSTNYDSLETYVNSTVSGFSDTFKSNVTAIAEQLTNTSAEIDILRSKIQLSVGEVDAEGIYTNANNEQEISSWSNTVGVYDAILQNFEYTDASGWVGTGTLEDHYGLRFNGNQHLTLNNQMKDDTIQDQSFTIEAFLKIRPFYNQSLTNIGYLMQLSNEVGLPYFSMNHGSDEISYSPELPLPVDSVVQVSYSFDAQLRTIEMYLNGETLGGARAWLSDESLPMPSIINIGEGFKGDLYTFRVYDRRLSPAEVLENYNQSITGNAYNRDRLIVNLEGRKAVSLAKAVENNRAEMKIMKDSINLRVTKEELDEALAISSGYVVIFSNENQTFATESTGALSEPVIVDANIDVFKGAQRIRATISTPVLKDNLGNVMDYGTMTVTQPTPIEPGYFKWDIPSGTNIASDSGWVELNFDLNGINLLKKITWSKAKKGEIGPQAPANYRLEILSSEGNIFMNKQISTILFVKVYYGDEDVTHTISDNRLIWTRSSANVDSDLLWNEEHSLGMKTVYINTADVYDRATFSCELLDS